MKHHEIKIYENTIAYYKRKIKVFLQFNLIIYPKLEPMSNTGLEKFLEAFIMKN